MEKVNTPLVTHASNSLKKIHVLDANNPLMERVNTKHATPVLKSKKNRISSLFFYFFIFFVFSFVFFCFFFIFLRVSHLVPTQPRIMQRRAIHHLRVPYVVLPSVHPSHEVNAVLRRVKHVHRVLNVSVVQPMVRRPNGDAA